MSPAQLKELELQASHPKGIAARIDSSLLKRLLAERWALLEALKDARSLLWHSSRCPAAPAGCGDQACNCRFDEIDDAADGAIRLAGGEA